MGQGMSDTTFSVRLPKEVQSESAIVDGIKQGLEDIKAGRTVAHEEVVLKSRAIVAEAHCRERKKA